jgi:glycosyltransferase involved in cell wall biosynthesis
MGVSICLPTCNRPELLRLCLESCVHQTHPPQEILVGDDSCDDRSAAVVEAIRQSAPCPVEYVWNRPSLGQAANVDSLFRRARGELICLIHDDGLLHVDALKLLTPCFEVADVVVAFGKHIIINADGSENSTATEQVNRSFHRLPRNAGLQPDLLLCALVQQFPNNGYIIRTDLAQEVGYIRPAELMGDGCDHAFSILCAGARPNGRAYFVDEFTTCYRLTPVSISRSNPVVDNAFRTFRYLAEMDVPPVHRDAIDQWLRVRAPVALAQAINLGQWRYAWSLYFSRWHRRRILTLGGARRLVRLLMPFLVG